MKTLAFTLAATLWATAPGAPAMWMSIARRAVDSTVAFIALLALAILVVIASSMTWRSSSGRFKTSCPAPDGRHQLRCQPGDLDVPVDRRTIPMAGCRAGSSGAPRSRQLRATEPDPSSAEATSQAGSRLPCAVAADQTSPCLTQMPPSAAALTAGART